MTSLTRILLNPARRQGRKLLTDPQSMHAAVRAAFPPDLDESAGRVLWRVDNRNHEHVLYIVGSEAPTADHIVEQAGWTTRPPQTAEYDRFLDNLKRGQKWWFELVANPTYSESRGEGKRGKVKAHVSAKHQLQWLHDRSEGAGFSLFDEGSGETTVIGRQGLNFYRNYEAGKNKVRITTARFEGELEVTDADQLRQTLVSGIGRAKGYGCGLMTLAPIKSQHG
ncbi:type I-E CRISPR-associated protein Cas6/Cse3/CasE [Corynebacterium lubricantis]|uniref:type I-E CRISPR-associated protein Cas6/Cse3/CasE n=1 Tax=Corynebacterium lubricantis TaxID=541095 RepID=UPI0003A5D9F8|nr:type I-E CRISPR-associated protein Cas6/Cse3/CasE [Corynebacterium lubricantis]